MTINLCSARRARRRCRHRRELRHATADAIGDQRVVERQHRSSNSGSNTSGKARRSSIDSPLVGTLINVGDSVLVSVRLHDDKALKSATMQGVTPEGSVDLGTFTQTPRYKLISDSGTAARSARACATRRSAATSSRSTRPTRRSTVSIIVVVATDSAGAADTATRRIDHRRPAPR